MNKLYQELPDESQQEFLVIMQEELLDELFQKFLQQF